MNPNLPIIVGESNPYGDDPHYAMYPEPDGCAGWRLCHKVMGLRRGTYMSSFERVNLLQGPKWSAPRARRAANELCERSGGNRIWILLGTKVKEAFAIYGGAPQVLFWGHQANNVVVLPHPSGRCRVWSEPGIVEKCRELLKKALPDIPFGEIDHPPLPKDVPHLFERQPRVPGTFMDLRFTWCTSCVNEPDYRGPCDCEHAPCVHQQPTVTRSG